MDLRHIFVFIDRHPVYLVTEGLSNTGVESFFDSLPLVSLFAALGIHGENEN